MAFPTASVNVGDTGDGTGTALDASGNVVAGNTVTVTSSDDTIVSITDNGSASGVDSVTWTAVAAGTATVTGSTTNPSDGSVVSSGNNNPLVITVVAAADLATSVSLA